ncbi:MAG: ABC transporter ATP-binding protein [Deltaproteobacteria bacterium]|nr:ABC transporter ATP-binding protein [Deltaproteobacteria bacterium]
MSNASNNPAPVIELRGACKRYRLGDTKVTALKGIDLAVTAGAFVAIKGPSGSGKSTLLNICGLLDSLDGGSMRLEGKEMATHDEVARTLIRRRRIGFIFQSYNLVPVMSVRENVEYPLLLADLPAAERRQRVDETLGQVGLARFADRLPDKLSGGQRQRVAIARALVKSPTLVIADEPTANLDTVTATQVVDLMRQLGASHGATFLIATHDDRMTAHCDQVRIMTDGVLQ